MRIGALPLLTLATVVGLALGGCVSHPGDAPVSEHEAPDSELERLEAKIAELEGQVSAIRAAERRAWLKRLARALEIPLDGAAQSEFLEGVLLAEMPTVSDEFVMRDGVVVTELDAVGNWTGEAWEGIDPAGKITTVVGYSDKDPERTIALGEMYPVLQAGRGADRVLFVDPFVVDGGKIAGPWLPTNVNHGSVTITALGRQGTFHGVPGTFRAYDGEASETETISVGIDASGKSTWSENDSDPATPSAPKLLFLPDGGVTAAARVSDSSYMNVGSWLTEQDDGRLMVETGAYGSAGMAPYVIGNEVSISEFGALQGNAVFTGVATGQYIAKGIDQIEGGAFHRRGRIRGQFRRRK